MGAAQSKEAHPAEFNEKWSFVKRFEEEDDALSRSLTDLDLNQAAGWLNSTGDLSTGSMKKWESDVLKDAKTTLARAVLDHTDIATALLSRSARVADSQVFNTRLEYQTSPITNQLSSGRCWLFASTNVIRYDIAQKLKVGDFQLSQSYLFFFDKLEKSNYFLELSIEHADLPLDSRLYNHLCRDPIGDGGQLDMAVNLLEKYGVVPQSIYPESYSSSYSSRMDRLLTTKLREYSLQLRSLVGSLRKRLHNLDEDKKNEHIVAAARKMKEEFMGEVFRILAITLGVPPKPYEAFKFEYYDTDGKFHCFNGTPQEFYLKNRSSKYPLTDSFSLVNDPRNKYEALYTVDKLGNVWGGRSVTYVNTTTTKLKEAVVASIKAGHPVFFGCDVGQSSHSGFGIMDTALYEYENAFSIKLGLSKADRLRTGESAMTHAMTITAVHVADDGQPVRYRVENSWGPAVGDKGYFVMSDAWFDEFVYQVVIPKRLASAEHLKILDTGNPTVYPPWDPMGTLA